MRLTVTCKSNKARVSLIHTPAVQNMEQILGFLELINRLLDSFEQSVRSTCSISGQGELSLALAEICGNIGKASEAKSSPFARSNLSPTGKRKASVCLRQIVKILLTSGSKQPCIQGSDCRIPLTHREDGGFWEHMNS